MSVTTSQRIDRNQFCALLGGSIEYSVSGAQLEDAASKTISVVGKTDAEITAAINTAAASFIDVEANLQTMLAKAQQAIAVNNTFLALASPTNAQTLAQVQRLTRENTAIIKILLGDIRDTTGT